MERRHLKIAGGLLILGTLWIIFAIQLAQALTPGYSMSAEAISGLGSTFFTNEACFVARCNVINQPASAILISALLFDGMLLLIAARILSASPAQKRISRMIAFLGAGTLILGLSYVPLYLGSAAVNFNLALLLHMASSFFLAAVAALLALRADAFTHPALKYLSRMAGIVVVVAIPLYVFMFFTNSLWGSGFGGVERIGFYTIFAWFLTYGVCLMNTAGDH